MKTYNIMLSVVFPVTHPRKGQPTGFKDKVLRAVCKTGGTTNPPSGELEG